MKLFLNSLVFCFFFICAPVSSSDIYKKYTVRVGGIKIGVLDWEIKINNETYSNKLQLKSEGLLSGLYTFEGEYFSEGSVENKLLKPKKYKHLWKTKKKTKNMSLVFYNDKLKTLEQDPIEKERMRVDVFNIDHTKDPLTSFLQIIMGKSSSLVLDGRRLYTMSAARDENNNRTIIGITNYSNLWADHKRSKFEKISFEKNIGEFLPYKMFIYFDGRVFKLEEN